MMLLQNLFKIKSSHFWSKDSCNPPMNSNRMIYSLVISKNLINEMSLDVVRFRGQLMGVFYK